MHGLKIVVCGLAFSHPLHGNLLRHVNIKDIKIMYFEKENRWYYPLTIPRESTSGIVVP
jgi:hypothetical protein